MDMDRRSIFEILGRDIVSSITSILLSASEPLSYSRWRATCLANTKNLVHFLDANHERFVLLKFKIEHYNPRLGSPVQYSKANNKNNYRLVSKIELRNWILDLSPTPGETEGRYSIYQILPTPDKYDSITTAQGMIIYVSNYHIILRLSPKRTGLAREHILYHNDDCDHKLRIYFAPWFTVDMAREAIKELCSRVDAHVTGLLLVDDIVFIYHPRETYVLE